MRKTVLAAALLTALVSSASASIIADLGTNPTSAQGSFSHSPAAGPFDDQFLFELAGGPEFLTIASVTNTFAAPADFLANFTGAVIFDGPGGGTVIGPVSAVPCIATPDCQGFSGSALLTRVGQYELDISGINPGVGGYGGNLSVAQVPGPTIGSGLPGLLTAIGCLGLLWFRRRERGSELVLSRG